MTESSWSSIPWTPFPAQSTPSSPILSWHKQQVPYKTQPNDLQNLEVWIPNRDSTSSSSSSSSTSTTSTTSTTQTLSPSEAPRQEGIWIIYIHGGAWRDPLVTSSSFHSTVHHLLTTSRSLHRIAGLASLNYTLSPHPLHPTHPTPSPDSNTPIPPSRSGQHPLHIHDVLSAISLLQTKFHFQTNYILTGHSCGATLSFQAVMNQSRFFFPPSSYPSPVPQICKPKIILGLNGLYSLPDLLTSPGDEHAHLVPVYRAFLLGAFGSDPSVWQDVSPVTVSDWKNEWSEGTRVVLVQSREDSLVGWSQTGTMLDVLNRQAGGREGWKATIGEMHATGDHNDLWREGARLAEIIGEICGDGDVETEME